MNRPLERETAERTFPGGGEMGARCRALDWSATGLGPVSSWGPALRAFAGSVIAAPQPMLLLWGEDFIQIYNDDCIPQRGFPHPAALGAPARAVWGESWPQIEEILRRVCNGESVVLSATEYAGLRRTLGVDQPNMSGLLTFSPIRNENGAVAGVLAVLSEAGRHIDSRYRLLFRTNPQPMWVYDRETLRFLAVNDAAMRQYGYSRDEFLKMTIMDIRPAEDVVRLRSALENRTGDEQGVQVWRHRRRDGSTVHVEITSHSVTFDGRSAALVLAHDITGQRAVLEDLRESEARYRRFFEDDLTGDFIGTPDGAIVACNQAFASIFGYDDPAAACDVNVSRLFPDSAAFGALIEQLETERKLQLVELTLRRADDTPVDVIANLVGGFGADGRLEEVRGYLFDITERKELERQLAQAQKMELVGRLAGGIAHDFNNLLTVIRGNTHALRSGTTDVTEGIEEIDQAATRAAELTHQLLAYGRQQVLSPQVVDLNEVIRGVHRMLRRVLGENVQLEVNLAGELWPVRVDPGQLEQVLMNLAVNARDAMPAGGTLRIATRCRHLEEEDSEELAVTLRPGDYVDLVVSDTGHGMASDVRDRVFEPFFTTKERGRGSGLGLATVYGIVTQSGGDVRVESAPGTGTSFHVLLPRAREAPAPAQHAARAPAQSEGSETVLVVEDEGPVRSVVALALRMRGYNVLEAADGAGALALCEGHVGPIDLLVTDVIMPAMTGGELQQRLSALRPHTRVLFMSGYTADAIDHDGIRARGMAFLQKPFTPGELLRKVREVLDGGEPSI